MVSRFQKVALGLIAVYIILPGCITRINTIRLYDLGQGTTIYAQLSKPKYNQGKIYTTAKEGEIFEGEYYIYGDRARISHYKEMDLFLSDMDLTERYGFGKNADARPVGTAIMIGDQGTVIQIVFYQADPNLKAGDGIAKDNLGNYYRVYLSEEEY